MKVKKAVGYVLVYIWPAALLVGLAILIAQRLWVLWIFGGAFVLVLAIFIGGDLIYDAKREEEEGR